MLWTYFTILIEWATPKQWMNMANNWEHFSDGLAAIDGTSLFADFRRRYVLLL